LEIRQLVVGNEHSELQVLAKGCHGQSARQQTVRLAWRRGWHDVPESRSELLRGLLLRRLSGNVGKHSLEYFASDSVRVFLR
jgi:hypothetical protein